MAELDSNRKRTKLYRIYIDESGDHTYHSLDDSARRYLGLTGCIIKAEYYRTIFHPALENLKQKHFPHNPDEPIILHRNDIINRKRAFWRLRDTNNHEAFNRDILKFFAEQKYALITVLIDKKSHWERYAESAFHPYHYCLRALLERYCGFLNFYNAEGDVIAEARQAKEDKELRAAYQEVYEKGTFYRSSNFFRNVLTSNKLKLKPKASNISGLQLADLLAYPSKQEILLIQKRIDKLGPFNKQIRNVIQLKYNRQIYEGRIEGYGRIFLK
jgi:hypothetical protein